MSKKKNKHNNNNKRVIQCNEKYICNVSDKDEMFDC